MLQFLQWRLSVYISHICVSLRVEQKLRTNISEINQKDNLLYQELALSTWQKFRVCVQTQWYNLILSFSRAQPSLWPTTNRETLSRGTFVWKESKLLKHQISNHEVQRRSLQEWLSMLEFWDFISSANLCLSQINYLISAGFYSLRIWCEKSKIPFGRSVVRSRELICVRVRG